MYFGGALLSSRPLSLRLLRLLFFLSVNRPVSGNRSSFAATLWRLFFFWWRHLVVISEGFVSRRQSPLVSNYLGCARGGPSCVAHALVVALFVLCPPVRSQPGGPFSSVHTRTLASPCSGTVVESSLGPIPRRRSPAPSLVAVVCHILFYVVAHCLFVYHSALAVRLRLSIYIYISLSFCKDCKSCARCRRSCAFPRRCSPLVFIEVGKSKTKKIHAPQAPLSLFCLSSM